MEPTPTYVILDHASSTFGEEEDHTKLPSRYHQRQMNQHS